MPWPISGASTSNSPNAGRWGANTKAGQANHTTIQRQLHGIRITNIKPATTVSTPKVLGSAGRMMLAHGKSAQNTNQACMICTAQPPTTQIGANNTPKMDNGVTTIVTQGIANKLAAKPTTENWPNHNKVSGASATLMRPCVRTWFQAC